MLSTTFLKKESYEIKIREENLDIVTGQKDSLLDDTELEVQQKIVSYLNKRFNTKLLFPKVPSWDKDTAFLKGQLVFVTAPAFDLNIGYTIDILVNFEEFVYQSKTNTNAGDTPTSEPGKWDKVGAYKSFYSVILNSTAGDFPQTETTKFIKDIIKTDQEEHNDRIINTIGDVVIFEGIHYINIQDTTFFSLRLIEVDRFTGRTENVDIAQPVSDDAFWKVLDTRQPLIVGFMIDLVLYELHSVINVRNVPTFRLDRRDDAIEWLKMVSDPRKGMTPEFPLVEHPFRKGNDLSWSSNPKQGHGVNY